MCSEMEKWQSVRLKLAGGGLQVDSVASILDIKPSHTARAGDSIGDSAFTQRTNEWIWEFPCDDLSFPERVSGMLSMLESKAIQLREILSVPGVKGEFAIECSPGYDDGVASLFPDALDRITALGLMLSLDLYKIIEREEGE